MDNYHLHHREKSRQNHQGLPTRNLTKTAPVQGTPYSAPPPTVPGRSPRSNTSSHGSHRHHHSTCTPMPQSPHPALRPTFSREGSMDSTKQLGASQYLKDELERQRKAEMERSASSLAKSSNGLGSSWHMDRERRGSSGKSSDSDHNRPNSSETDQSRTNEMGLRDMRRTVDQLQNENFNLKFELYHRREKQPQLEIRVDELEANKSRLEELNDKLLEDVEKRDKAVQEAVSMIVMLEAKVDQMSKDLDVVRRIQTDPSLIAWAQAQSLKSQPQAAEAPDIARVGNDERDINRMPSFVSMQNGSTDNLRDVYLSAHGSTLSLKRDSTVSPLAFKSSQTGITSPNFSNLSTSSFPSIYGASREDRRHRDDNGSSVGPHTLDSADGLPSKRRTGDETFKATQSRRSTANRVNHSNSFSSMTKLKEVPSIQDIVQGSPLQRIERLDQGFVKDMRKPQSRGKDSARPMQSSLSPAKRTKEDKREMLRRVTTEVSGGVRLNDFGLPPTPDTLSTGTLNRFKTSDETLANTSENSFMKERLPEPQAGVPLSKTPAAQNMKTRDFSNSSSNTSSFFEWNPIPRPRSVDETSSLRRGYGWDAESDLEPDAPSLVSSDIWMKESARPEWDNGRSTSPDMFGFPPSVGGWGPGGTYSRHANYNGIRYGQNGLFSIPDTFFQGNAPSAPNRRSTLQKRTGPLVSEVSRTMDAEGVAQDSTNHSPKKLRPFMRRNSDIGEIHAGVKTPVQGPVALPPPDGQKRNHYPPISGQGGRSGFNRLFRRSIGGTPKSDNGPSQAQTQHGLEDSPMGKHEQSTNNSADYVEYAEDDVRGATPPPILLKPHHERSYSAEQYPNIDESFSDTSVITANNDGCQTPTQNTPAVNGAATGSRRKWLPNFGRSNSISLKSRIN